MLRRTALAPPATPAPGSDRSVRRVRRYNRISAGHPGQSSFKHLMYRLRGCDLSLAVIGDIERQGDRTRRFALLGDDAMEAQRRRCIAGIPEADVAFQPETLRSRKPRSDHSGQE